MSPSLDVLRPGPRTSLQDLGRTGWRAMGLPVSGAMDRIGLRLANALVGNPQNEGCLELTLSGPLLRIETDSVRIAIAGPARLTLTTARGEQRTLSPDRSWRLGRGDLLEIGPIIGSAVAYLAVEGGFAIDPVLGSLSTHLGAGLGPLGGRALGPGLLPLRRAEAGSGPDLTLTRPLPYGDGPIRVIPGPQAEAFTEASLATLLSSCYRVGMRSDRMGMRLEGPKLVHRAGADIVSDGIVAGCLQVSGDGGPILLLADHQTTGGYAKIATAISADLPRLGRAAPGDRLFFQAVTVEQAEAARRDQERALLTGLNALAPVAEVGRIDLSALYRAELISGVVTGDDEPVARPEAGAI
ncbi:5-oxoprolinase subunit C family protein [Magnetospirillum molischianum]|uniref:Allophanate hydrolase subunit 2 n=1 Tax=Magnetospirillum molischianum DSM 120 TaxID=1150626 RepID=H8FN73_MAGML|nr:biotin-dependent carboxyltransferase family protein [Magnetospirillum molischianum]CCG39811.1 Allophanate hydrolase subunit 2 [Magnetospirillum molischianum DSM 120]